MLEGRLEAYRRWLQMDEPTWARVHYPKIDFQDLYYYAAPKSMASPKSLDEIDPQAARNLCQARHSAEGTGNPRRCEKAGREKPTQRRGRRNAGRLPSMRCSNSVSVVTTFKAELKKAGVIFCSISEALREHPDLVRTICFGRAQATISMPPSIRQSSDGSFVYVPPGVRCPMELSTYFRMNAKQHRPVRAHTHHRRQGRLRQLSRRLHGAHARGKPASRRRRRIDRPSTMPKSNTPPCRTGIPAMPRARAVFTTLSPSVATAGATTPKFRGHRWKPAAQSPGNIQASFCGAITVVREFYSIAISNGMQQVDTGTKMIHLGKNSSSRIISKGIAAGRSDNTYRGLVERTSQSHQCAQLHAV